MTTGFLIVVEVTRESTASLRRGRRVITSSPKGTSGKRTMSAAVRAKIARSAKARWAKFRAEKVKKAK